MKLFTLALISFSLVWPCIGATATALGASPVADAAEMGDWSRVATLLNNGEDPAESQPDGMTALHWAVYHNHRSTIARLLEAGGDPNGMTQYRVSPLAIACTNGCGATVKMLLETGADPHVKLAGGETMLMRAARTGKTMPVQLLLEHGAKTDAVERAGQTSLMWAAAEGNTAVVDLLVGAGADLKKTSKNGFTAMFFAAREGRLQTVQHLLAAGVDVNETMQPKRTNGRNPRGGTSALMLAVESGHFELACRLLSAGADPDDQRSGYAPLHAISWVRKTNRGDGVDGDPPPRGSGRVNSLEFVKRLVTEFGADVNLPLKKGAGGMAKLTQKGATPFLFAARTADLPLMQLLWEMGADPDLPNVDGCTPLMAAAGVGVVAVGEEAGTESEVVAAIDFLVQRGSDINTIDRNGETAMHGAAYRNFPLAVARLAYHGADPAIWNRKNRHKWDPIMIAQGHRPGSFKPSPETVAALRAALK